MQNVVMKILMGIISSRIIKHLEDRKLLHKDQRGFTPGFNGCHENNFLIHAAIGHSSKETVPLYITFVDLKNAFGSIPQGRLLSLLQTARFDPSIVQLIQEAYRHHTTEYTLAGTCYTQHVASGILQGCTLSPTLACLYFDELVRDLDAVGSGFLKPGGVSIHMSVLAHADHIAIIVSSRADM